VDSVGSDPGTPDDREVESGAPPHGEPVTITLERVVAPGREREFEDWAADLTGAAASFDGFLGAGLLRPGRSDGPWHVVYRFDSREHLADWEGSAARAELLERAAHLMETTAAREFSGLETWFSLPGRTAPAPPRWKMFAVSVTGIFTLQLLFHLVLDDSIDNWPLPVRVGVLALVVTALMTWLVMPHLARLLANWLYPRRR